MNGHEIRRTFLDFFARNGHRVVRSSSLVPVNDPTLLFTNAGMNQFKDVFLGLEKRDYKRAVTSQKCVRAGGKHNDLENVGRTARHHTFFEMLGNFSFGDYFKKEAIAFAWELVTREWKIPRERLYASVYKDDDDAAKLWQQVAGLAAERIARFDEDNFWAMGDTGPCGPCSEVFYDFGAEASEAGHTDCQFPCDCGRYVEIWNLVFMQFNRDAAGKMTPLPKPCVDTGAGLERVSAVLQGKISNFDTDLLRPLIDFASELSGKPYGESKETDISLRILADHSRAAAFLIGDGVLPSNEGRGYVLRKILRRAVRHGRMLGLEKPFLFDMAGQVADQMKPAYPELLESIERVVRIMKEEEKRFARTVEIGLQKLDEELDPLMMDLAPLEEAAERQNAGLRELLSFLGNLAPGEEVPLTNLSHFRKAFGIRAQIIQHFLTKLELPVPAEILKDAQREAVSGTEINTFLRVDEKDPSQSVIKVAYPGERAFRLYDTFGLPRDLIEEVVRDRGLLFDDIGFRDALDKQRERAKASWKGAAKEAAQPVYTKLADKSRTEAEFHRTTSARDCKIVALVTSDGQVKQIPAGAEAELVLDRTPFYAEAGGQMADVGTLFDNDQTAPVAEVRGAYYPLAGLIAHRVVAKEKLCVGDRVAAVADGARREHIKRNHTATHLMHAALRNILGTHVKQSGSLVAPDHLRFDFSHFTQAAGDELAEIERQVNEEILKNLELETEITGLDAALASGALAFFGDKYPEQNVRVVTIPDAEWPRGFYSKELCGGTHVARTGEIGVFKFMAEQSVAAGVRRVEAITGERALAEYQRAQQTLAALSGALNVPHDDVVAAVERLGQTARQLEKQLDALKKKAAHSRVDDLLEQARTVKDVRVLSARVPDVDRAAMRQLVDTLRQKLGSGVVVLGTTEDGKVALITGVTKDLTGRLHAGKIVQEVARQVGGSGGGRPDLAEAGGKDTSGLEKAMAGVFEIVERML